MADVTAKDLAKTLGISAAAVSMALNGKPGVSRETRDKVLSAAAESGYTTPKARQSEKKHNNIISFVIYLGAGVAEQSTFSTFVLRGVEAAAKEQGYRVLIHYIYENRPWEEQLRAILNDACGAILLGTDITEAQINRFMPLSQKITAPLVVVDNFILSAYVDCVGNDNVYGAKSAVSYLIECGHRSIGYLRARQRIVNFVDRELGIRLALGEHEQSNPSPLQVVDVDIATDKAYADMRDWLAAGNKPVSAYFAENDMVAAACIRALREQGYRVPDDVSVIGFDDVQICEVMEPRITTMHAFKERLGRTAFWLLETRLKNGDTLQTAHHSGLMKIALSLQVRERESVKHIKI